MATRADRPLDWNRLIAWAEETDTPRLPGEPTERFVFRTSPVPYRFIEPLLEDLAKELEPAAGAEVDDTLRPKEPSGITVSVLAGDDGILTFRPVLPDARPALRLICLSAGQDAQRLNAVSWEGGLIHVDLRLFPPDGWKLLCLSSDDDPAEAAVLETFALKKEAARSTADAEDLENPYTDLARGRLLQAWWAALRDNWSNHQVLALLAVLYPQMRRLAQTFIAEFTPTVLPDRLHFLRARFKNHTHDLVERRQRRVADLSATATGIVLALGDWLRTEIDRIFFGLATRGDDPEAGVKAVYLTDNHTLVNELYARATAAVELRRCHPREFFLTAARVIQEAITSRTDADPGASTVEPTLNPAYDTTISSVAERPPEAVRELKRRWEAFEQKQPQVYPIFALARFAGRPRREIAQLLTLLPQQVDLGLRVADRELAAQPDL